MTIFKKKNTIVMLSTNELIEKACIMQEDDKLFPVMEFGNRNLYVLSGGEAKGGDWVLYQDSSSPNFNNQIFKYKFTKTEKGGDEEDSVYYIVELKIKNLNSTSHDAKRLLQQQTFHYKVQ